ncbi:MAG: hypothetical protein ACXVEF_38860 [Polyangiales bacterium]
MRRSVQWTIQVAVIAFLAFGLARLGCGRVSQSSQFDPSRGTGAPGDMLFDELLRRHPGLRAPMFVAGVFLLVVVVAVVGRRRDP